MDVRATLHECVPDIESVLADMREGWENDDGDEDDGERVFLREVEECRTEREGG